MFIGGRPIAAFFTMRPENAISGFVLINCKIWAALLSGRSVAAVACTEKPMTEPATRTGASRAGIQRSDLRDMGRLSSVFQSSLDVSKPKNMVTLQRAPPEYRL